MTRIEKLKKFLSDSKYNGTQVFKTPNTTGDKMVPIYKEDGIEILYCPIYDYLEIFNLTDEEYAQIIETKSVWDEIKDNL